MWVTSHELHAYLFEQVQELFALCLVQKLKASLPPSKQALLYHANQANLIVYIKYVEETGYSQLFHTRPWVDS